MDVKRTFLNKNLTEDMYMTQSEGFVDPKYAGNICKLQKSIYELKQTSQSWNLRFDEVVKWSLLQLIFRCATSLVVTMIYDPFTCKFSECNGRYITKCSVDL
jgi:hypothetical protein